MSAPPPLRHKITLPEWEPTLPDLPPDLPPHLQTNGMQRVNARDALLLNLVPLGALLDS